MKTHPAGVFVRLMVAWAALALGVMSCPLPAHGQNAVESWVRQGNGPGNTNGAPRAVGADTNGFSELLTLYLEWSVRSEAYTVPGLAAPARTWPTNEHTPTLKAANIRDASELYCTTNIWLAHLNFSPEEWKAVQPKRIAPLPNFYRPDGSFLLRNPNAQRSGLSGVLGFDFHWAHADLEVGGAVFTNVAARVKGNGSHLLSLYGDKRAFKVDLNKHVKGQKLAGRDELTLNNLVGERSCMSEALGYEFFREAQVPAPRTAFAYLSVSVAEKWQRKPLGLYLLLEPVDDHFAAERFGTRSTPIFKPVTYHLFEYLGDSWTNYSEIYDVKTEATPAQQRRLIDFARLVSVASDEEFAARVADFLDVEEFARFLAGQVILSNYDGLLCDGQNFYIYLDPKSQKFGFIPWDLSSCWGAFPLGLTEDREQAAIWHPWVAKNLFLERVMEAEVFRKAYRVSLEEYLERLFIPERLFRRMDELARLIRPAVAAESAFRLKQFDRAVADRWEDPPPRGGLGWAAYPVHQMKRFIEKRAYSVRQQLDGKSRGVILDRAPRKW